MFRRLFPRLVLLLGGVLIVATLLGLFLLQLATREISVQYTARSFATKVVAADALLQQPDRAAADARLYALGIERRADKPPLPPPLLPFHRDMQKELSVLLPQRSLAVVELPQPMLWIAAEHAADGWVGVPLLSLRGPLRVSTVLTLLSALLLVFGAAAWYVRSLVEPLHQLVEAAPGLFAGAPAPALPGHVASEIAELAGALDRAAADTRAAAEERQLLLAGLSHDMRAPLARLALALELLDGGDPAIRAGMAADVGEIDAIIEQFIAFVRDGRDEPGRQVDLGALIDEALAAQASAGRTWQRTGTIPASLYAKPLALRRALDNLLENAVRHGVMPFEIELHALPDGAVIDVRDRGPGVATEALAELGRPFYRADRARTTPGSGLGLATAARIAAWHGGALELRNRDGGGFEAKLRLRAARA